MVNRTKEIKDKLIQIFNESGVELNLENLNENLELDSLHYISIICEIENIFDIEVPDDVLGGKPLLSFNDFFELVFNLKG